MHIESMNFMIKILLTIFILLTPYLMADDEDETIKVVYHCDYDDEKRFNLMMDNIRFQAEMYESNMEEFDIRVVANGSCSKFMDKTQAPSKAVGKVKSRIDTFDIKFYVCELGMKFNKVKRKNLIKSVNLIPLGLVEITKLQHNGYAYLKIQ